MVLRKLTVRGLVDWIKLGRKTLEVMASRKYTVCFEGNIGSGKTSCLEFLSQANSQISVVSEPVNKWRDVRGVNLFQLMYSDPKKWGFAFQSYVQLSMLQIHRKAEQQKNITMMERSIYSARYCFVENLFRSGNLKDAEFNVLDEWFSWLVRNEQIHVDLIVYLKTDPEVVYERVKKRSRNEETGITLDFLKVLHNLHEEWLTKRTHHVPAPVLTLDANIEKEKLLDLLKINSKMILGSHKSEVMFG